MAGGRDMGARAPTAIPDTILLAAMHARDVTAPAQWIPLSGLEAIVRAVLDHPDTPGVVSGNIAPEGNGMRPAILTRLEALEADVAAMRDKISPPPFDGTYAAACRVAAAGGKVACPSWPEGWVLSSDGQQAIRPEPNLLIDTLRKREMSASDWRIIT